ncbi:MAG: hypothetical protein QOI10_3251 [Solirubrobacterales bacterium]|jgi:hypothetical protein|nr:hypothetical protein [Solirubrobacterales bacterium]
METEPNEAQLEDPNDEDLEDPSEAVDDGEDVVADDEGSPDEDEAPTGP